MGCLEFVKMKIVQNRKEWRNATIHHLIGNGNNATEAIAGAKNIEEFVFSSENEVIIRVQNDEQKEALKAFIESLVSETKPKESPRNEHPGDYVAELIQKQRLDAEIALKVIQQFQFSTLPELVQQIELMAHGYANITGSLSK